MDCKSDEEKLKARLKGLCPELMKWGYIVDKKLNNFVQGRYVELKEMIQIKAECRIKDESSFIAKALYRGKNYKDPLLEITDKVGTRLVLLCSSAVDEVSHFIEQQAGKEWVIKEKSQDIAKIRDKNPETFTYQSVNHR